MGTVHKLTVTASLDERVVTKTSEFTMDSDYEGQIEGEHIIGQTASNLTKEAIKELGVKISVTHEELSDEDTTDV